MQAVFENTNKDKFTLGSLSLTWIDIRNIFDSFQEDTDYNSEIIFKATGNNKLVRLSELIERHLLDSNPRSLRQDIKQKLIDFCAFLKSSDGVILKID